MRSAPRAGDSDLSRAGTGRRPSPAATAVTEMFADDEGTLPNRSRVLLSDQQKQLLQKINIQGSSLGPTCACFYEDRVSGAVCSKLYCVQAR